MGWWSDSDNKDNLSSALIHYATNEAVTELGNIMICEQIEIVE